MDPAGRTPDQELVEWLAEKIGAPAEQVERDLHEGDRRRAIVVEELLEAGVGGRELLQLVMRLTGLDESSARALIAAHERDSE